MLDPLHSHKLHFTLKIASSNWNCEFKTHICAILCGTRYNNISPVMFTVVNTKRIEHQPEFNRTCRKFHNSNNWKQWKGCPRSHLITRFQNSDTDCKRRHVTFLEQNSMNSCFKECTTTFGPNYILAMYWPQKVTRGKILTVWQFSLSFLITFHCINLEYAIDRFPNLLLFMPSLSINL